jgi:hypothetical protein
MRKRTMTQQKSAGAIGTVAQFAMKCCRWLRVHLDQVSVQTEKEKVIEISITVTINITKLADKLWLPVVINVSYGLKNCFEFVKLTWANKTHFSDSSIKNIFKVQSTTRHAIH